MLLIFDEVQTGLGTTGRTWCCQHFGVLPDLMAFGKKAQACGVMAGPRIDEVKDNAFRLPSRSTRRGAEILPTWCARHTSCTSSKSENLVENARVMGERIREVAANHRGGISNHDGCSRSRLVYRLRPARSENARSILEGLVRHRRSGPSSPANRRSVFVPRSTSVPKRSTKQWICCANNVSACSARLVGRDGPSRRRKYGKHSQQAWSLGRK